MGVYDDREPLGPGRKLGRYEIISAIGEGGMGRVWAARLEGTHGFRKVVAIKTVHPAVASSGEAEKMLLNEAHLASQIHHRHVVEILDVGEDDGVLFIVMEWVDGESLHRILHAGRRGEPMPHEVAARIAADAASGLHAAHELTDEAGVRIGLVHRDVSPQNILVSRDGTLKVVDFGIAKAFGQMTHPTRTGELKGKLSYMSPEQVNTEPVDHRSDIFSLGIVLFEMVTGSRPFVADHEVGLLQIIARGQAPKPSTLAPGCPAELEDIVMTALARDPAQRFQTAEHLSLALEGFMSRAGVVVTGAHLGAIVRERCGGRLEATRKRIADAMPSKSDAQPGVSTPSANLSSNVPPRSSVVPTRPPRAPIAAFVPWAVAAFATLVAVAAVVTIHEATERAEQKAAAASPAPPRDGPILVRVRPSAARVTVGGAIAGAGDQRVTRPAPGATKHVSITLEGYAPTTVDLASDDPDEIRVELSPLPAASMDIPPIAITSEATPPAARGGKAKPGVKVPANPY